MQHSVAKVKKAPPRQSARAGERTFHGFGRDILRFLSELAAHNDRGWFDEHRSRYERSVRETAFAFIDTFAPGLERISGHLLASSRRSGGSLMRIHRDIRFSKDKRPFKTNIGIQFRHELGRNVHAPGYYLHIEPGRCFVGAGIWRPDADAFDAIRARIADVPHAWRRARDARRFSARFAVSGEQLKRMPRGYAAHHPMANDLQRKDFIGISDLETTAISKPTLVDEVLARCADAKPFMRFLCTALELRF